MSLYGILAVYFFLLTIFNTGKKLMFKMSHNEMCKEGLYLHEFTEEVPYNIILPRILCSYNVINFCMQNMLNGYCCKCHRKNSN